MRGIFGSVSFAIFYATYPLLTIAEHVSLQFLFPIFLIALSWPILGEKPVGLDGLAVTLGAVGTLLVVRPEFMFPDSSAAASSSSSPPPLSSSSSALSSEEELRAAAEAKEEAEGRNLGIVLNVVAAAIMSAVMLVIRLAKGRMSALQLSAWFHGFSVAVGALSLLGGLQAPPRLPPTAPELGLLLLISCTSFAANVTLNYAFQQLPAARAAGLNYVQIVWGFLLDVLVLQEPLTWSAVVGAVLIAGGGLMVRCVRDADEETAAAVRRWCLWFRPGGGGGRGEGGGGAGGGGGGEDSDCGSRVVELATRPLVGSSTAGPLYAIAGVGAEDEDGDVEGCYEQGGEENGVVHMPVVVYGDGSDTTTHFGSRSSDNGSRSGGVVRGRDERGAESTQRRE